MFKALFNSKSYRIYWKFFFWVVFVTMLYLTLIPTPPQPISIHNIDKLYHFAAFAGFTFAFRIAFRKLPPLALLAASLLFGVLIEFAQLYIPGRGFSIGDMIADSVGVLFGYCVASQLIVNKK
ncbi:VanZ family protein [Aliikangiella coralliicola]|uniref:VanZ family protein n=1 Tax=Aliikangiella coralliicola TaxID=2592383 RepID=A0A545TSN9_9GAMM|nr:VanZ family protein [Aliikangiella coralliicola]